MVVKRYLNTLWVFPIVLSLQYDSQSMFYLFPVVNVLKNMGENKHGLRFFLENEKTGEFIENKLKWDVPLASCRSSHPVGSGSAVAAVP